MADAILASSPGCRRALEARGQALLRLGRREEAVAALESAWTLRPSPQVARLLAQAYAPIRGLEFCLRARDAFPQDGRLQIMVGILCERARRSGDAEEAYRRAADLADDEGKAFAYARRIRLALQTRDLVRALEDLEDLLRVRTRAANPYIHALHADFLTRMGRHDDAAEAYAKGYVEAVQRGSDAGFFLRGRAYALRRAGRFSEARPKLEQVIEADPRNVVALAAYVADARREGGVRHARAFLFDLLRQHPEHKHLWGWVRRLTGAGVGGDDHGERASPTARGRSGDRSGGPTRNSSGGPTGR